MARRSARPRSGERKQHRSQRQEAARKTAEQAEAVIEMESEESFPASDAPSWTVARVGQPARKERKR